MKHQYYCSYLLNVYSLVNTDIPQFFTGLLLYTTSPKVNCKLDHTCC